MKHLTFVILGLFFLPVSAQLINVNPDKSAEPWYVGSLRLPSQEEIDATPVLKASDAYKNNRRSLPSSLDNSTNQYFRPVFSQADGSCAQASGVGYTFTYEMNWKHDTDASIAANQFPTHYTYNFLNNGSGDNGSWYQDGWNIIKANGCPNVPTYGGLTSAPYFWMSGYDKYESGMNNRVKDHFVINVGTPDGLNDLKYWLSDHMNGSDTGGIVNFAAGVTDEYYMTYDYKIIRWGHNVNHAMTIVGWDDSISYDYNNDGVITNDIDTNNDGVVNMKDWERGALIMVNSWGDYFGNNGKAYMMYRTLAESPGEGGIYLHSVWGIHVKDHDTPQLLMRVKMTHNSRKDIKIFAGISTDVSDVHPDHVKLFPIFSRQGGDYYMRGVNSNPIEFTLDVSPLLSYINSGEDAKVFLIVNELDIDNNSSGEIIDFSIIDSDGIEHVCSEHHVPVLHNSYTFLSVTTALNFETPDITTDALPVATVNVPYSQQLTATGGTPPYTWSIKQNYTEESFENPFPEITNKLTPDNDDDGIASQTLDFDFPFYGKSYNTVYVSTDGSLLFDPGFSFVRNENAIMGHKVIAAYAHDLITNNSNQGIYYEGDANSACFRWKETLYEDPNATVDVAVKLYPDGKIEYYYNNGITTGVAWASGISDGKGNYEICSNSGEENPANARLKMLMQNFPTGMSITDDGTFEGTLHQEGSWDIDFVVTDNNAVSDIKTLNLHTTAAGVSEFQNFDYKIYPNPASDLVHFQLNVQENAIVDIEIFDISGRRLAHQTGVLHAGNNDFQWKNNLQTGIYTYKMHVNKRIVSGKLFIE